MDRGFSPSLFPQGQHHRYEQTDNRNQVPPTAPLVPAFGYLYSSRQMQHREGWLLARKIHLELPLGCPQKISHRGTFLRTILCLSFPKARQVTSFLGQESPSQTALSSLEVWRKCGPLSRHCLFMAQSPLAPCQVSKQIKIPSQRSFTTPQTNRPQFWFICLTE